jgi:hypothetical protein
MIFELPQEGTPCLAQMPASDGWGDVKEWEGPFHLTPEGVLIQPSLGGYDGERWWRDEAGVLFRWSRLVPGVPEQTPVSFTFGYQSAEGSS